MSTPVAQALTVPQNQAGVMLQDFLAGALPGVDWVALRGIQARGGILVNGMPADRNVRLHPFDHVELRAAAADLRPRRDPRRDPVTQPLATLFESAFCLVVAKPAGVPTVPDRSGLQSGVHGRLQDLRPGADLRIVHRLDRDTSGCLILGKGLAAAQHFDLEFRQQRVRKRYLALVAGAMAPPEREVRLFLGPDPRRPGRVIASATERRGFRAAATTVRVVEVIGATTLVELQPHTGRSHQLRVHLAAIGHPILGDTDYGGRPLLLSEQKRRYKLRPGVAERPLLARQFLHCAALEFRDVDGSAVAAAAPLADDLQTALERLTAASGPRPTRS